MKSGKWIRLILKILGFAFCYVLPILLFGDVIPYTQDGVAPGLTKMGFIAIGVIFVILGKKLRDKCVRMENGIVRALILSVFPIVAWLIIQLGIKWILPMINSIAEYWLRIIIFIVIGRACYILEEALVSKEVLK